MEKPRKFFQQLERYERYSIRISQYILELYEHSGGKVNVELDLSNYAAKVDLKGATSIDSCTLAQKGNTVPAELSILSDVVDNNVVKKTLYK